MNIFKNMVFLTSNVKNMIFDIAEIESFVLTEMKDFQNNEN